MKRILFFFAILFFSFFAQAQNDSSDLKISIITCSPGEEVYACFGHSAIRVIDKKYNTDLVYNYGTFNFEDPNFLVKFTRGKLLYYLNPERFENFMYTYQIEKRSVYEQQLNLSEAQKEKVQQFLTTNSKDENKYYHYDFLLDNCSSRLRNIFENEFPKEFKIGKALTDDSITYRQILNHYLGERHWMKLGINLLLSKGLDKKMTNEESMFLPDFLMKGFRNATINNVPFVKQTVELLPAEIPFENKNSTSPFYIFSMLAALIFIISLSPRNRSWLLYFDVFFFMILGLLGLFMLFMWFGTDHQNCANNINLLWALPTHLIFAFLIPKQNALIKKWANVSFQIVFWGFILNFLFAQHFPREIIPLILLSLYRMNFYRQNNWQKFFQNSFQQFSTIKK